MGVSPDRCHVYRPIPRSGAKSPSCHDGKNLVRSEEHHCVAPCWAQELRYWDMATRGLHRAGVNIG